MNTYRRTINLLAVVIFTLTFTALAQAQLATRTWVSGTGDDVNPCSRTAPCKTFAGAISKTADGGEINALDPGGFGAVTITKSVTIDGKGTMASILASGVSGVIINDQGSPSTIVVNLRNLQISGGGNAATPGLVGVKIVAAKHVSVENCVIFNFQATTSGNGRGISDTRTDAGSTLMVTDTIIENNAKNGIAVLGPTEATIENVRINRSTDVGTAGLAADNGANVTVRYSVAASNPGIGFFAGGAGTVLELEDCVSVYNNVGVQASAGAVAHLSNAYVTKNNTGLSFAGATMNTFGNNKVANNTAGNAVPVNSLINPQ